MSARRSLDLIEDPTRAATLLNPMRLRLLESLREPDSAAGVARKLELPRQKVHYHLRELERSGLVEAVEERRKGNVLERILRATATHYLISPEAFGGVSPDPGEVRDRFSSTYLVAVAAKTIRDLARLRREADEAGKRLATFTLQTEVRFAAPRDRKAFSEELAECVAKLVDKYHDAEAEGGRAFHFHVGAYPAPDDEDRKDEAPKKE